MILDYLFLPALFLIGLVTSYQDFRYGKIKNKWIISALIWGIGVYSIFSIWNLFSDSPVSFPYILKVLINGSLALIIGYLLWRFNLWSAGDAKLFFVFSLLLPLKFYWHSYLPFFPSLALLINTFILALVFLFIQSGCFLIKNFRKISKGKILEFRKKTKNDYLMILKNIFGFFSIFLLLLFLRSMVIKHLELKENLFGLPLTTFIFLIFYFLRKIFQKIFQKPIFLGIIFLLLIPCLFLEKTNFVFLTKTSFFYIFFFSIFSGFLSLYLGKTKEKYFPFAIFLFLAIILTVVLKGSVISFLLKPWPLFAGF